MNRNPLPKPSRIRHCPAVSRDIPSSECATHRIARYQCPEGCVYHPFGSARYLEFLKIEGALDVKLVRRLRSDRVLRWRVEREFLGGDFAHFAFDQQGVAHETHADMIPVHMDARLAFEGGTYFLQQVFSGHERSPGCRFLA